MPKFKSPVKARLQGWHLKRVPFPATPFVDPFNSDPLRNGAVFARDLRQTEITRIRHALLKEGFAGAVKPWAWMWAQKKLGGSLGMGKTALLTYITDQINQDYGRKFFGHAAHWLAVYVPVHPTTKSVPELAATALACVCNEARGTSLDRLLLGRIRRKVIMLSSENEYPSEVRQAAESKFLDDKWLSNRGVDLTRLATTVHRHLRECRVSAGFAQAIAEGSLHQYLGTLNGDANLIPARPSLTAKALTLLLNDLARVVNAAEVKRVTFLLDDFYYLVKRTPPKDRIDLASELRAMAISGGASYYSVKENLYNWIAVMHTNTAYTFSAAWESVDLHKVAPLKLNAEESVVLHPFPVYQGKDLLEAFLRFQRPSHPPYDTYPFSAEALAAIVALSAQGKPGADATFEPRSLLQAAYEVTCAALLREDVNPPLGPAFVEHVLTGVPLSEVADSDEDVAPSEKLLPVATSCLCTCHTDEESDILDIVAIVAGGGSREKGQQILGYRCMACNMPTALPIPAEAKQHA